jgi:hypothetical protein
VTRRRRLRRLARRLTILTGAALAGVAVGFYHGVGASDGLDADLRAAGFGR